MNASKKKLLIVDDEPNLRTLYFEEFTQDGYDVVLADNGRDALKLVGKEQPDLVILDIRMPGMDGLQTMSELLGHDNQLPVIINSAYGEYKDNFMSWSADAYITKSPDLTELKDKVLELLQLTQAHD